MADTFIVFISGVVTGTSLVDKAEKLKLDNPEKYVAQKNEGSLPAPYYEILVDQHTGEGSYQCKIKDYDITKPQRDPFSYFEETCLATPWGTSRFAGCTLKITDSKVRRVSISFDDDNPLGKKEKAA